MLASAPEALPMTPETFARRRRQVLARLGGGALVLPAAPVFRRSGDAEHAYRQESDLLYLTGFREPETVLVLNPAHAKPCTLFVRPRDKEMETWNGRRAGLEGALRDFGADQAYAIGDLEKELPKLLAGAQAVFHPFGLAPAMDEKILRIVHGMRERARTPVPVPDRICDLGALVHELRLQKDDEEIAALRTAAELTRRGHLAAMRATKPGVFEYELEAELLYAFRKGGGDGPGYEPIVAAGVNATILHYRTGRDALRDGELLLVDAGAEFAGYSADVTRTWPANGRFTAPQAALYEIVLAAHGAAVAAVRPGTTRDAVHEIATKVLIRGLLDEKLLAGTVDGIWADRSFRRFYMHGTSHWLGLDVHDVGGYYAGGSPRPLAPGFVLTIEPGLYIAPDDETAPEHFRGIGIRIEDDVLVTAGGREVLTEAIPRTITAMAEARRE
jgi:Xaa-Pro aminopeptidase